MTVRQIDNMRSVVGMRGVRTVLKRYSSEFSRAQMAVKGLREDPGNDIKLSLYGLFKQASAGDVSGDTPSMFDMVGKAKYSKWESFKGMAKEDAQSQYIAIVKTLMPTGVLPEEAAVAPPEEKSAGGGDAGGDSVLPQAPSLKDIAGHCSFESVTQFSPATNYSTSKTHFLGYNRKLTGTLKH